MCDMAKRSRWQTVCRYITRSTRNPESLARGVGLGFFIGFLPAIGFQVILAFLLSGFFNANRLVAILGTLVTNPLTAIPVSAFSLWLGDWILPGSQFSEIAVNDIQWSKFLESPSHLGLSYLFGCLVLSITTGLIGYLLVTTYFRLQSYSTKR